MKTLQKSLTKQELKELKQKSFIFSYTIDKKKNFENTEILQNCTLSRIKKPKKKIEKEKVFKPKTKNDYINHVKKTFEFLYKHHKNLSKSSLETFKRLVKIAYIGKNENLVFNSDNHNLTFNQLRTLYKLNHSLRSKLQNTNIFYY